MRKPKPKPKKTALKDKPKPGEAQFYYDSQAQAWLYRERPRAHPIGVNIHSFEVTKEEARAERLRIVTRLYDLGMTAGEVTRGLYFFELIQPLLPLLEREYLTPRNLMEFLTCASRGVAYRNSPSLEPKPGSRNASRKATEHEARIPRPKPGKQR